MFGISFKSKPASHYEVGSEVEANYNNKGKWMEGTVIRVREDNTFDIEFKNGRKENSIPLKRLKPINHSAQHSGVASPLPHGSDHHSDHDDDNISVLSVQSTTASVHSTTDHHHHKPTKRGSMTDYFHSFTHSTDSHGATSPVAKEMVTETFHAPVENEVILESAEEANETEPEIKVKIRKKLNRTGMKQRIKKFRESIDGNLDISELDLDQIPVGLFNAFFDSIKILNVSRNQLTSLSNTGYFLHLTHLDLSHNNLENLAGLHLYSLKTLRCVDLSWNKLTEISGELTSLAQLETLLLSHNLLTALPSQDHMAVMKSLVKLDLSHNRIFSLTDELESLLRLDDLNLAHNMSEFFRKGAVVSVETVFEDKVGPRTMKLLEKKSLYCSKEARRSLVKTALVINQKVVIREQEERYKELQARNARRNSSSYNNNNNAGDDASVGLGSTAASVDVSENE